MSTSFVRLTPLVLSEDRSLAAVVGTDELPKPTIGEGPRGSARVVEDVTRFPSGTGCAITYASVTASIGIRFYIHAMGALSRLNSFTAALPANVVVRDARSCLLRKIVAAELASVKRMPSCHFDWPIRSAVLDILRKFSLNNDLKSIAVDRHASCFRLIAQVAAGSVTRRRSGAVPFYIDS